MIITVEDYQQIRQLYLAGHSQRSIAKALHLSRNTVAKYCAGNAVPWARKAAKRDKTVITDNVLAFIRACLDEDDREQVKKQHHTATRIYTRLVSELGFQGGPSTVRRAVQAMKAIQPTVFIPLAFSPGEAIQVDWGEATIYLRGEKIKVNLFCARLCSSCVPLVYAYRHQNQESFLEAFVRLFDEIGGVPRKVIFDNAKVAVKEGFGAHAIKQAGYTALSAHYGFEALFCNPAEGHEKGLVEGLVGWARRNILVPVPRVDRIAELNTLLDKNCLAYLQHKIPRKPASVGAMYREEQAHLRPLPGYPFETAKCTSVRVNAFSTVRFQTNDYSVPVTYCGQQVSVKAYAERVEVYSQGDCLATHDRHMGHQQVFYKLDHYLPILAKRGRALFNAAPVRQHLPPAFLAWLNDQVTDPKELMQILRVCAEEGWEAVWADRLAHKSSTPTLVALPAIKDNVKVAPVNLKAYDALVTRKVGR